MHPRLVFAVLLMSAVSKPSQADHAPGNFEHHPDIVVALYAAEPQVVDPVALAFAANGDCFVVEMRDYPYGFGPDRRPGGTVRLLRDTDHDGRADFAAVFAEGLSFPTSVTSWRDGILVMAPPQVLYLADTNGDDRADVRQVVIDGLSLSVTDSNANGLRWGLDNLVHAVNGGSDGNVFSPLHPDRRIDLSRADFAFLPNGDRLQRTAQTSGGFGLVFDAWGHSFTTHNLDYLQQRIIALRYLENSPELPATEATVNISDEGVSARLFPIVQAETRVNHPEQAGRFSSAGGMGLLERGGFSERLHNSIFVCDVVSNLVHRDVLREDGPTYRAGRAPEEQDREFLASRDPSFRPVGIEHGPDGALYLIDMQRDVIEHPDYIPAKLLQNMDIRAGDDRGRIYRITPRAGPRAEHVDLARAGAEQLIATLGSPHTWRRVTAHRLLFERRLPHSAELLESTVRNSTNARARVGGLWALAGVAEPRLELIAAAAADQHAGVRENAVLLLETKRDDWHAAVELILQATRDPHPRVRFQAALSLSGTSHPDKINRLAKLLVRDNHFAWSRKAVLAAVDQAGDQLLESVWGDPQFASLPADADKWLLVGELADVAAAGLDGARRAAFLRWLEATELATLPAPQAKALLTGLARGWQRQVTAAPTPAEARPLLAAWSQQPLGFDIELLDLYQIVGAAEDARLQRRLATAHAVALSKDADVSSRIRAVDVLSRLASQEAHTTLMQLLSGGEATDIQAAAVAALRRQGHDATGNELVSLWPALSPGVRSAVIDLLLARRQYHDALVGALENNQIAFSELNLDLEQRRTLMRWSSPEIGERAARLFGDEEYSNRKEIVDEWLAKLPTQGDPGLGQAVFQKRCASCHRSGQLGDQVGPDLTGQGHRSVEDLLTHILDPNMAIHPNYITCAVVTEAGEIVSGILHAEDQESVTLLMSEAKQRTIPRREIAEQRTLKTSLMPEGLEKELTPEEIGAVIAFVQSSGR